MGGTSVIEPAIEGAGSVLVDLVPGGRSGGVNAECPRGRLFNSGGKAFFLPDGESQPRQVIRPGFHPSVVTGLVERLIAGTVREQEMAGVDLQLDPPCEEGIHHTVALKVVAAGV